MRMTEMPPLRQVLVNTCKAGACFWDAGGAVALPDLCNRTSFGNPLSQLAGRSVLVRTVGQLSGAMALIELDGIARRLLVCPSDLPGETLASLMSDAEIDAVISDRNASDWDRGDWRPACPYYVVSGAMLHGFSDLQWSPQPTEWLLLTSGTSGPPKIVRHSMASLTAAIGTLRGTSVWSTFYDVRRFGGLQILLRAVLGGSSLVLSSAGENVADHLKRLATHAATHVSGTPSHWRRVLMSSAAKQIEPRYVRLSGEIADEAILTQLRITYPQASICHAYASTEAGVCFEVNDGIEGFPEGLVREGRGEVDIRVEAGTLRIRSRRTASGYLSRVPSRLLDDEGFVDTGDLVELRGTRYFFIGRKEGIINVGGLKVHPEEIEAAINRHPEVHACQVRSRKNYFVGAMVEADIVLKTARGKTGELMPELEREIIALCRRDLAPHKVPVTIRFVARLELTATGKLVRHA
jgi:acyl-CoA synthetase (AMP-forming)/AMP-acid ligase II